MFEERVTHIHCQKCGAGEEHLRVLIREYTERKILSIEDGVIRVSPPLLIGDKKARDQVLGCAKCKHTWGIPDWLYEQIEWAKQ